MEKTPADIMAEVASLRQAAANYRYLAEQREAAGEHPIAQKLTELVDDLEARAAALEAGLPESA